MRVESGEVGGILITTQETTARVTHERRMRAFFEQAPAGVALLSGPQLRYVIANQVYRTITGRNDIVGQSFIEAFPELAGTDTAHVLSRAYESGETFVADEHRVLLAGADGTLGERFFALHIAPLRDGQGKTSDLAIVAVEVTEQVRARRQMQQAQDRLAFTLHAAMVGHWELDLASGLAKRSLRHDQIFGYSSELPAWTFETFIGHVDPAHRERVVAAFQQSSEHGADWSFECPITAGDGSKRWIAGHGRRELLSDGSPSHMLGIVIDTTERKRAEEERLELLAREREARADAEAANRAKDDFLAMLGHELRNPLAPIVSALQLLRQRSADDDRPVIAMIDRQVKHMVRLVDDLLDVSRITRGKIELAVEPLEVSRIVADAVETVSPLLDNRKHRLTVDLSSAGLTVDGDPVRLAQVLSNLLTNAAKYTNPGGHVHVHARQAGPDVVIAVRDTGIGIASEIKPHIFAPFVQQQQDLDRSQGGLGLGLSIVKSLVALHDGSVEVHSAGPGQGSEFRVTLPASRAQTVPAALVTVPEREERMNERNQSILVVDDNEDAAAMLAELLQQVGYHVETAFDGPAALRQLARFRPDIALLDIGLPGMDGYELARLVRQQPGLEQIRLVAITGYGQAEDRQRAESAGFDAHLVKPVDPKRLQRLLDSFVA